MNEPPLGPHPYDGIPLLLVSGLGRSGTTVLRNCIAAHSRVDCTNAESNLLNSICELAYSDFNRPDRRKNLQVSPQRYWALYRQLILQMVWPQPRVDTAQVPAAISTYAAMTPRGCRGLQKIFPRHRICFIIRNGIEVVSSFMNFDAFKQDGFEQHCRVWSVRMDMVEYGEQRSDFLLFRHEWFLDADQTRSGLEAALRLVGLQVEDACVEVAQSRRFHPTRVKGESREAAGDLARRGDRWRQWSEGQRRVFEELCQDGMQRLGFAIPWRES